MSNLENILAQVDQLQNAIKALPPIAEKDKKLLRDKFRLEWNYNSNHIEGNTLTYQETELLLIFDKTTGDHTMREYEEMKAHDVAVEMVREFANNSERPLTETDVKDLNKILLVRPFWTNAITPDGQATRRIITPGDYKKHPNSVRLANGEMFHYAEPEEVHIKMQELLDWYRDETADLHPVVVAAMLHYRFVLIHPFDDGNGRVSRLLMNYHLMKNGLPPVVIKTDDKKNYLAALNKADTGELNAFVAYIGEQLLWSLDLAKKAREGESVEEKDDWKKQVALLKKVKTRKENTVVSVTGDVMNDLLEKSILPLIEFVNNTFSEQFNDLFARNVFSTDWGKIHDLIGLHDVDFKEFFTGSAKIFHKMQWNGYLNNGTNTFDAFIGFKVHFGEFNYRIMDDSNDEILPKRLYSQSLTETEYSAIANILGKRLLETIQRRTDPNL